MGLLKLSRATTARSDREVAFREARYFEHLSRGEFGPSDPPYSIFAFDPFHDGEVRLRGIRLASRTVTITFRNVYAVDSVDRTRAKTGLPKRKLRRNDFRTRVIFHGVRLIVLPDVPSGNLWYRCSNLFRDNGGYRLAIQVWGRREYGLLTLSFAGIDVEDVAPKIAKYLPLGADPVGHLGYAKQGPGYYARRWRTKLRRFESQNGRV